MTLSWYPMDLSTSFEPFTLMILEAAYIYTAQLEGPHLDSRRTHGRGGRLWTGLSQTVRDQFEDPN